MLACLRTAAVLGVEAFTVHVEVDVVNAGLPQFSMVGLPDTSVRESRDRVRSAIRNSGFEFPGHKITVNLAPADIRKGGSSFDLPVALGILGASGFIHRRHLDDTVILGELSLDGSILPARGVLPIAASARRQGQTGILVPAANAQEAVVVGGLRVFPVESLAEALAALNDPDSARPAPDPRPQGTGDPESGPDFADVRGQALAKRALEVAAAGGHNVLLVGPPGAGKTMMARRLPGVLPPLSFDEALEVTAIHSVAGQLPPGIGLLSLRPFRAPHHTISDAALVGGGTMPRPGEISLAHHGVLFLDEIAEFDRRVLEVLRQPLEDGCVAIARAARTVVFPARFTLVAAMNPCPCGNLGHATKACRCTPVEVQRYRGRLSGPLRDRIDLVVEVPPLPVGAMSEGPAAEPSSAVRRRVVTARTRQAKRLSPNGWRLNSEMQGRTLWRYCKPEPAGLRLLEQALHRMDLSARGWDRVLRVSRTIADLARSELVTAEHVAEALQYRMHE